MTHFQEIRWANDQQHIASRFHAVPTDHGALAEGLAGAAVGSGLRGDGGRSGRRGPKARGLVRPGMGAGCLEFHRAKRPVRTASAVQVRQPVFRTSVGRWKHYEQALGPLFNKIGITDVGNEVRLISGSTKGELIDANCDVFSVCRTFGRVFYGMNSLLRSWSWG